MLILNRSMALRSKHYAKELMTIHPRTLHPDDLVMDNIKIFEEHKINHVPVVNQDGIIEGLLARRDFESYANITKTIHVNTSDPVCVRDVMSTSIFIYSSNIQIVDAAQAMVDNDIHAILIADEKKHLLGIVTSTDLLRHMADRDRYSRFT